MNRRPPWLDWATELQSLAQAGLAYSKDPFDIERFTRIRAIAADILHHHTDLPAEKIRDLFCNESGYQTPKVDARAAIIDDDARILLVQENNGLWALPGGWADINHSIGENVAKEAQEEAGLDVIPERLIAVQDHARHNHPANAYTIYKIHILCRAVGGAFRQQRNHRQCLVHRTRPAAARRKQNHRRTNRPLLCRLARSPLATAL